MSGEKKILRAFQALRMTRGEGAQDDNGGAQDDNGGAQNDPDAAEKKRTIAKGKMARRLVYYCIAVLTVTALWAAVIMTVAVVRDTVVDLTAVLSFIGAAFGGELLLLLLKRVFAKPTDQNEEESTWNC